MSCFFRLPHEIFSGLSVCPFSYSFDCLELLSTFPWLSFASALAVQSFHLTNMRTIFSLSGLNRSGPHWFSSGFICPVSFLSALSAFCSIYSFLSSHLLIQVTDSAFSCCVLICILLFLFIFIFSLFFFLSKSPHHCILPWLIFSRYYEPSYSKYCTLQVFSISNTQQKTCATFFLCR